MRVIPYRRSNSASPFEARDKLSQRKKLFSSHIDEDFL
jgi:hypothetical protein